MVKKYNNILDIYQFTNKYGFTNENIPKYVFLKEFFGNKINKICSVERYQDIWHFNFIDKEEIFIFGKGSTNKLVMDLSQFIKNIRPLTKEEEDFVAIYNVL